MARFGWRFGLPVFGFVLAQLVLILPFCGRVLPGFFVRGLRVKKDLKNCFVLVVDGFCVWH